MLICCKKYSPQQREWLHTYKTTGAAALPPLQKEREEITMKEFEKAAYSRLALNEVMNHIKAVRLTAPRKNCYYPIYSDLKAANNWL